MYLITSGLLLLPFISYTLGVPPLVRVGKTLQ